MIAEVVPYARTPRTMTVFDYSVPEGVSVQPGDIVSIPFRKRELFGMVWKVKVETTQTTRPLSRVIPYPSWHSTARRAWLAWFAEYYAISLSHAFKTLQYPLPKRTTQLGLIEEHPVIEQYVAPELIRAQRYSDIIAWYATSIPEWTGHTVIVCPEYTDVVRLRDALASSNECVAFIEEPTMTQLVTLEKRLSITKTPVVVIGTKKILSISLAYFGQCILDQEESSSHKQTDLNPRYHVRRTVEHFETLSHQHVEHAPKIILTSIAPSIESFARTQDQKATYTVLPHAQQESLVRIINMDEERGKKNFTWFSESVIANIAKAKRTLLFLNRTGQYSHTVCTQCSGIGKPTQTQCATCGSFTLKPVRKGIEQLEKELREALPEIRIGRIDSTVSDEAVLESLEKDQVILATEKIFRVTPLSLFDYIGILSVDHILAYPHYRSHERVYQLLRSFFSEGIRIDLQTSAPHHPVIVAASAHDYNTFAQSEITVRKLFKYPPYGYRARLVNTKTRATTLIAVPPQQLPLDIVLDPEY